MPRKRRIPADLDYSELDWLQHRDLIRISVQLKKEKGLDVTPDYLSKVKRKVVFNVELLAALFAKARENKAALEKYMK